MRLSDVRSGMRCTGLSVVRGTAISSFDVEVIDVVSGDASSAAPRILVRTSGPAVDATGIGFGFSGSPILCRDGSGVRRTAGAISATVSEYGNKTVLATPIEEMLGEPVAAPRGARRLPAHGRPLSAALSASGLSPRVRRVLARAARRRGVSLLTPPAGPLSSFPRQSLAPGAAVSASLASGDINLGAIGTVSYRDGDRLLAFGHPLDAAGTRSLLMQDAYVYSVIANPGAVPDFASYKLASPGHDLGTFGFDGLSAVTGRVGALPRTTQLTVTARGPSGRRAEIGGRVADERALDLPGTLAPVGGLALAQASDRVLRSSPARVTTSMCLRIRVRERRRALGFCNSYFDPGAATGDFEQAMDVLDGHFGRLTVTDVSARLRISRGVREALLVRGRASGIVRPGRRARIRLVAQDRRSGRLRVSFVVRVPRDLRPGRRVLVVGPTGDGSEEDALLELLEGAFATGGLNLAEENVPADEGAGDGPVTRTLSGLAFRIAAIQQPSGLNGRFSGSSRRLVLRSSNVRFRDKIRVPLRIVGRRRRAG